MDWLQVINAVGFPAAALIAVVYMLHRTAEWIAPRIDRIITKHVEFIEALERSNKLHSQELASMDATLKQHTESLQRIDTGIQRLVSLTVENGVEKKREGEKKQEGEKEVCKHHEP